MRPKKHIRILPWCLAAAVLLIIFVLTLQAPDATMAESSSVQQWLIGFFSRLGRVPEWIYDMHEVRSSAHLVEYAALAAAIWLAMRLNGAKLLACAASAALLSSLAGLLDETLKIYLPTREFDGRDLMYDVAASLLAAAVLSLLSAIFRRRSRKMKTTLLIMAAGIGSRYGGGVKQLEAVGPNGELIIDYSIHDAIAAGFDRILFVIRKDIEADFMEVIGERIEKLCAGFGVEVAYAFQDLYDLPEGISVPDGRGKPWGTGQALLAARDIIDGPFAVINADDYYGKSGYRILHDYLVEEHKPGEYAMAAFILGNTLSDNGGVTRGIVAANGEGFVTDVVETSNIEKKFDADGKMYAESEGNYIDPESYVSMNMWGFGADYIDLLKKGFVEFLGTKAVDNPLKAEFLIPIHIGELLKTGEVSVKLLESRDSWFGVTYHEDKPYVVESFKKLIAEGAYSGTDLYSDIR